MRIQEIMGRRVRQISSSAMLGEAIDRMRALGVCALPVVENNQIVGVVTEHDITARTACEGMDARTTPVQDVMTTDAACCSEQDEIGKAVKIMEDSHGHWLVVLGPDRKAIGMLSSGDLASKAGREPLASEAPETIREPARGA